MDGKGVMPLTSPLSELEQLLGRWANFYLIASAAAATLIGLLFVVITLAAERRAADADGLAKIRLYLTPTVVYFASVLGVATLLTFPNHSLLSAMFCICLVGLPGLIYTGSILIGGDKKSYEDRYDLLPYAAYPFAAYGVVVLGGVLLAWNSQRGLTVVAVGMLAMLTIGIRNSWAIAIGVLSTHSGKP
jgi:hypothetical protein